MPRRLLLCPPFVNQSKLSPKLLTLGYLLEDWVPIKWQMLRKCE